MTCNDAITLACVSQQQRAYKGDVSVRKDQSGWLLRSTERSCRERPLRVCLFVSPIPLLTENRIHTMSTSIGDCGWLSWLQFIIFSSR